MTHPARAIVFALIAVALGPWAAALWQTGGSTKTGSSPWLRRTVRYGFWLALLAAIAETLQ